MSGPDDRSQRPAGTGRGGPVRHRSESPFARLTVLAYHRIGDADAEGGNRYRPVISADPSGFALQMRAMRRFFNVISNQRLTAWLDGEALLPPRPALVTFDDGYRDNLLFGVPVLKREQLPAIVFLTSDHIGSDTPLYWDLVAYCFHHTPRGDADIPLIGPRRWAGASERQVCVDVLMSLLKRVPEEERAAAVRRLPGALDVDIRPDAFSGLHASWDDVRQMLDEGMEMGAHTCTHPILTRVSPERAELEIAGSKERIEAETGRPVTAFAYPNGKQGDYDIATRRILKRHGFRTAFTLEPGPSRQSEVRRDPFAVRRIYVGRRDSLPRFLLKVLGVARLLST